MIRFDKLTVIISALISSSLLAQSALEDDFEYRFEIETRQADVFAPLQDETTEEVLVDPLDLRITWAPQSHVRIDQEWEEDVLACDGWYYASYEILGQPHTRRFYSGNIIRSTKNSILAAAVTSLTEAHNRAFRLASLIRSEASAGAVVQVQYGLLSCSDSRQPNSNLLSVEMAQRIVKFHFFGTPIIRQMGDQINEYFIDIIRKSKKL